MAVMESKVKLEKEKYQLVLQYALKPSLRAILRKYLLGIDPVKNILLCEMWPVKVNRAGIKKTVTNESMLFVCVF